METNTPMVVTDTTVLTQKDVPVLISQLKSQLEHLQANVPQDVSLDVVYDGRNIKNIDQISTLLEISSSIHARAKHYDEEVKRYELGAANIAPFKTFDKSVEQWEAIIKRAIHELINRVQIDQLKDAIKGLEEHLDEETKLANKLKNIFSLANKPLS